MSFFHKKSNLVYKFHPSIHRTFFLPSHQTLHLTFQRWQRQKKVFFALQKMSRLNSAEISNRNKKEVFKANFLRHYRSQDIAHKTITRRLLLSNWPKIAFIHPSRYQLSKNSSREKIKNYFLWCNQAYHRSRLVEGQK